MSIGALHLLTLAYTCILFTSSSSTTLVFSRFVIPGPIPKTKSNTRHARCSISGSPGCAYNSLSISSAVWYWWRAPMYHDQVESMGCCSMFWLCSRIMIAALRTICRRRSGILLLSELRYICRIWMYSLFDKILYISEASTWRGAVLVSIGRYVFSIAAMNDCIRASREVMVTFLSPSLDFFSNLGRSFHM